MKRGRLRTIILDALRSAVGALSLVVALTATTLAAEAPRHLGGFVLGAPVADFKDAVDMDTCLQIRYMEYVQEAEIRPLPGFKSGLIGFGTCADYGKILRIKLKYADESKRFFNEMMKRLRQRFGEPDEYRGDPFHVLVAWKWSFEDPQGNRVSLTMQHNTKDEEEKMGNAIKLTLTNQLEKERACYEAKKPRPIAQGAAGQAGKGAGKVYQADDWKRFVPY
jgi:hypothetical protein